MVCEVQSSLNIYNNNIYNIYNNTITNILDNKGITDTNEIVKEKPVCENRKIIYLKCQDCGSGYQFGIGCDSRTCEPCQAKRRQKLFMKYKNVISGWVNGKDDKFIRFMTLTFKNVDNLDIYVKKEGKRGSVFRSKYIERCDLNLRAFKTRLVRAGVVSDYGFVNKECTWSKEKGFHYHFHILSYGSKFDNEGVLVDNNYISALWLEVTKTSFITKLDDIIPVKDDFKDNKHALHYLLKYVAKVEESNQGLEEYFKATKGTRYFNTFGMKYGKSDMPVFEKSVCQECGGKLEIFKGILKDAKDIDYKKMSVIREVKNQKKDYELKKLKELDSQLFLNITPLAQSFRDFFEKQKEKLVSYTSLLKFFDKHKIEKALAKSYIFEPRAGFVGLLE